MYIYNRIAEQLQFLSPEFYKERFFKKLQNLSPENVVQRNVEPELLWVQNFVKKDSVVLEIGANVGAYLYLFEKTVKNDQIFAFEPHSELYKRLKRIFPKMNIFPYALSDQNTMADFKIPVINGKEIHSRGTLQTHYVENDEEKSIKQQVKVLRLDDWEDLRNFEKIDFIKIDVEGNEMRTLRGAKATIQKFRPVLMVEMEQRHHKTPIATHISEIESWGYKAHFLNRKTFETEKFSEFLLNENGIDVKDKGNYINNIIFFPV